MCKYERRGGNRKPHFQKKIKHKTKLENNIKIKTMTLNCKNHSHNLKTFETMTNTLFHCT